MQSTTTSGPLTREVQFLRGVGPTRAEMLGKLGICTIEDLLYLAPKHHHDLRAVTPLCQVREHVVVIVQVRLEDVRDRITRTNAHMIDASFSDATGFLRVHWFNRPDIGERLQLQTEYFLTGKIRRVEGRWLMTNPRLDQDPNQPLPHPAGLFQPNPEPVSLTPTKYPVPMPMPSERSVPASNWSGGRGMLPVYPLTDGLRIEQLRRMMRNALEVYAEQAPEMLPDSWRQPRNLMTTAEALWNLHFPASETAFHQARTRLVYDEFLTLQVGLALKRHRLQVKPGIPMRMTPLIDERIRRRFPFNLTAAQNQVVADVVADLAQSRPMYRLLQGDVGSGKTAIAIYAMLTTIANGCQTLLLAPTEVLARQHFQTIDHFLRDSQVRRSLLVGSLTAGQRRGVIRDLASGEIQLVVGTHALFAKDVTWKRLGLVVIDEQHKFGVKQRAHFQQEPPVPHHLVMTATPIPRSLSMTWFGDLDLSILCELPPGRKPTKSYVIPIARRVEAYRAIRQLLHLAPEAPPQLQLQPQLEPIQNGYHDPAALLPTSNAIVDNRATSSTKAGPAVAPASVATAPRNLALVVCPRIDENSQEETDADLQSLRRLEQEFRTQLFPDIRFGVLHGRMSDVEKEKTVQRFRQGEIQLLLATVIVEVGIDVPGATIVVIENAERFGLSQLHQLRGRVGRDGKQGYCFLLNASDEEMTEQRLQFFADTNDGFKIAEMDAELRGIGEPIGVKQSGFVKPRVGDFFRDVELLYRTRSDAAEILRHDPQLADPAWVHLRDQVLRLYAESLELALVG